MPIDAMNMISDVLPALINGSTTPVGGTHPVATPMLMKTCMAISAVKPVAISIPNVLGALSAIRTPRHISRPNATKTSIPPIYPNSSTIIANIQSDSLYGRYKNFCRELPSPSPKSPPEPIE